MTPLRRHLFLSLLFLVTACTTPAEQPVAYAARPPGTARLVFYRAFHYYGPSLVLTMSLNHVVIGTLPQNAAIYRDVAPGTYTVSFSPTRSYPDQFKTVTAAPGNVFFIRIDALPQGCSSGRFGSCDIMGFTSTVIEPTTAQYELQAVPLLRG
jgi:hypothetical protein